MTIFLLVVFFVALFSEGTLTTLPLTLLALIILLLQKREQWIFPLAFVSGILLDVMTMDRIGIRSIFFVFFLFFMVLYEKKYEIQTLPFVSVVSFFGSLIYLFLLSSKPLLLQSLTSCVIASMLFFLYSTYRKRLGRKPATY